MYPYTFGFIDSKYKAKDIAQFLAVFLNKYVDVDFYRHANEDEDFEEVVWISFNYKQRPRMIHVFENYSNYKDTSQKSVTLFSMQSTSDKSIQLITTILEEFGGCIIENDEEEIEWTEIKRKDKEII